MLTKSVEVMKYIRSSAGRAGINVVFEEKNEPRHDGRTIYLPAITVTTTLEELKQMMASVDHEVGHDLYSDFGILHSKKLDPRNLLMYVWNFLEDSRINVIQAREYRGFRLNYDETSVKLLNRIIFGSGTNPLLKFACELISWETKISKEEFPLCEGEVSKLYKPEEKIQAVLSDFNSRLIHCQKVVPKEKGTLSTYELAYDLLKAIGKDCGEFFKEEVVEKATEGERDGEGEKTSERTSSGKEKEVDVTKSTPKSGKSCEKERSDTTKKVEDDEYKILSVEVTNEDLKKICISVPREPRAVSKTGINFDKTPPHEGEWVMTDFSKFKIVDFPNKSGDTTYLEVGPYTEAHKSDFLMNHARRTESLSIESNFAGKVRRLIQIRAQVQTQYGVKKGKLDQSRLSRVCFNTPAAQRVFKNKIENKTLDAAVSVLVDMSGSMGGDKVHYAMSSAVLLNEVCSTLNIPVEIVGFTDDCKGESSVPLMFIYKGFNNIRVSKEDFESTFATSTGYMAGNPDGENILWAYDRLLQRKEKNRLLIVMSDGAPAASKSSTGLGRFTEQVIKEIETAKKVQIYGLGICSHSVEDYYTQRSVIKRAEEIPQKLLELIDKRMVSHG